jgi:hypothetical protein
MVSEERLPRELPDVVVYTMSVVAKPPATIETSTCRFLEMRRLLGVLREQITTVPARRLALGCVDRRAGAEVAARRRRRCSRRGDWPEVPAGVDRLPHRAEALTNVLKHAGGKPGRRAAANDSVTAEVDDEGAGVSMTLPSAGR